MRAGPSLEIGGFPIQFPYPLKLPRRFALFQKASPPKEFVCVLRPSFGPLPLQEKIFYGKKRIFQTSSSSKGLLLKIPQNSSFGPPVRAILLNQKKAQVTLYLKKGAKDLSPFVSPILFLIVYYTLVQKGGFFLHSSSVMDHGKGLLFVGPGGSGKSTIAEFFDGEKNSVVLNDDRTIVRKSGSRFRLFGTPWNSSCQSISARSIPLTAIFFLAHGRENHLTRLLPKEAVRRFLPELHIPSWDPIGHPILLSLALEVCTKIPSYSLTFTPQKEVVSFLRNFFKEL